MKALVDSSGKLFVGADGKVATDACPGTCCSPPNGPCGVNPSEGCLLPYNISTFNTVSLTANYSFTGDPDPDCNISGTIAETWTREGRNFTSPADPIVGGTTFQAWAGICGDPFVDMRGNVAPGGVTGFNHGAEFTRTDDNDITAVLRIALDPSTYISVNITGGCGDNFDREVGLSFYSLFPPSSCPTLEGDDGQLVAVPGTYNFSDSGAGYSVSATVVIS